MHLVILILSHTLYGCVDWNKVGADTEPPLVGHTLYGCVDWNIEDCLTLEMETSHTLYGCVDWNPKVSGAEDRPLVVTPCMGVWIETKKLEADLLEAKSHPVWVCGLKLALSYWVLLVIPSHPVWVCGLKLDALLYPVYRKKSHPVWVCGLKHVILDLYGVGHSHTLYGCVDWNYL